MDGQPNNQEALNQALVEEVKKEDDANLERVQSLLASGADPVAMYSIPEGTQPEDYGLIGYPAEYYTTALHQASIEGQVDILQALLDKSSNLKVEDSVGKRAWEYGCNKDCVALWAKKGDLMSEFLQKKFEGQTEYNECFLAPRQRQTSVTNSAAEEEVVESVASQISLNEEAGKGIL